MPYLGAEQQFTNGIKSVIHLVLCLLADNIEDRKLGKDLQNEKNATHPSVEAIPSPPEQNSD